VELARKDYHAEIEGWKKMDRTLPVGGNFIALTHGYGFRLMYYGWVGNALWPYQSDLKVLELSGKAAFDLEIEFAQRTAGMDYFLVTHFVEFDQQAGLKEILHGRYPSIAGDGYLLFDLTQPK